MNEENIKFTYSRDYDLASLRGVEAPRPWDFLETVKQYAGQKRLLDIGCGTAAKLVQLADYFHEIIGMEPNPEMRKKAEEEINGRRLTNVRVVGGSAEELPFDEDSFDIVTCMLAPHVTQEVYRVLKPQGRGILEKIGERDKANIKLEFGSDQEGPRGYLMGYQDGERETLYRGEFRGLFSETIVRSGRWKTWYSPEGLVALIQNAKTVRAFDRERDREVLCRIIDKYSTPKGIETEQHRILIVATK